jgi:hypothetical protein
MSHVEPQNDAIEQLLAVARSFAELTHRAMSDSEISLAAADMMGFAARQAARLLEEFIASHAQKAHNALAFAHTTLSAELDKAYADFECLMDASAMIRLHGIGSHYTTHLTYLMRYAAESACEHLERAEQAVATLPLPELISIPRHAEAP